MSDPAPSSQFGLLRQRRFAPFFGVQFLGAANDNLFKFAFTVLVTYRLQLDWLPPAQAGLVIGAAFIAPFLLFSATAGQLADRHDKARLTRWIKTLELAIVALGAWGFVQPQSPAAVPLLLACIVLLGLHSTLFGPVKYAYLPQHLREQELTGGNGMVEMGTFVAILLGNLAGGLLIGLPEGGPVSGGEAVAAACLVLAVAGRLAAQWVPPSPASAPDLRVNWNPVSETLANLRLARAHPTVFRSLLGISWLWFFGAVLLSQFPAFARQVLHGDERVASLLLAVFSIGIACGSLLCERLARRHVEIGLVPLGAIGMSLFAADLYLATRGLPPAAAGEPLRGLAAFLALPAHWRVLADLALLSAAAGLFSVPMYALIQLRAPASHRARVIAANNILNALFMVASSLIVGALLTAGVSIPQLFGLLALANALVAAYIFWLVPEYLLRFVAYLLSRCVYRFRVTGDQHLPSEGAAILVCNHVSFVDAVLLMAASPRPVRFLMDHRIFAQPLLGPLFRLAKAIPLAPRAEDPVAYEAAFAAAAQVLREGELLGLFPEGAITRDGQLAEFRPGVLKILAEQPVPVVPVGLSHLWGSFFSRVEGGRAMVRPFRRGLFNRVRLSAGPALAPDQVTLPRLRAAVGGLIEP
ncbi:MAG: MFS transporter [Burkholderiaceae bacterium]|nr:MFS transporter [Burkholderiaceae bacterium]